VRLIAIEVTVALYRIIGGEVKRMVQEVEGIKPNMLQTITKRMNEIDEQKGGKYVVNNVEADKNPNLNLNNINKEGGGLE